jgi:hypothetical protein
MQEKESNIVLIKPRAIFFKALGGFKNETEALQKALAIEKELTDFLLFNNCTLELDIQRSLQFRQKLSHTEERSIDSDQVGSNI